MVLSHIVFRGCHANSPSRPLNRAYWRCVYRPPLRHLHKRRAVGCGAGSGVWEMSDPIILCGSMFGLGVRRHRKFESSFPMMAPQCNHKGQDVRAYYGQWGREAFRSKNGGKDTLRGTVERAPRDMGIDWMNWSELTQAIPPAYSEFIGLAFLNTHRTDGA